MRDYAIMIIQPAAAMVLAPMLLGVINWVKANFAGRRGQPLLQPYYDLWKLLHKSAVYSSTTSWIFKAMPIVCLSAILLVTFIIPLGFGKTILSFNGDLILAAYLLGLIRFFIVIGALDTGSSFEGMGASREVQFSALAEPAFFIAMAAMARQTSSISFSNIFSAITPQMWATNSATLLLVTAAIVIVLLAENSRIPVDDPNTHLELTMIHEVMILDNSGPDFAFLLYSAALKLWIFAAILVGFILPMNVMPWQISIPVSIAAIFVVSILIGIVESCMARLRLVRVPHLLFTAVALAILALIFTFRN
ncbi:MAG: hydrogenase [Planctomycetes bacterium GWF2_41_51]|nr:MAG: hydrogenase [Planctomycetes bacterium GWF2_41_51]HBG25725.1 hydrogenase [Phycisphaerales bacterium]